MQYNQIERVIKGTKVMIGIIRNTKKANVNIGVNRLARRKNHYKHAYLVTNRKYSGII